MTEREAIKELHDVRPRGGIISQKKAEALAMAIKALKKQIPKKLIRRRATDDDVENELRDFITCKGEICRCPACRGCIAIYEPKYCMECGQRLDWGTESE